MPETPLSTSALAKALGKTTKQMFAELDSLGWIRRQSDNWQLTTKGEFEGGRYRQSQKFGRYIIWPADVVTHAALVNPDTQLLSSSKLARHFDISRKTMDQLLSEAGWVKPGRKGWLLTPQGEVLGGCQREIQTTAVPFVLWDAAILESAVLIERIKQLQTSDTLVCCDGHQVALEAERKIDNWLYFAGLLHAYRRRLPCAEELYSDFYLPSHQVFIEYWGDSKNAKALAAKLRKKTIYEELDCRVIELRSDEVQQLDDHLSRALLKYGIET